MAGWSLTVNGRVFREDDLTMGDVKALEVATGVNWRLMHPLRSGVVGAAIHQTLLVRYFGLSEEVAAKQTDEMKANDLIELIGSYEDDDLPTAYENGFPPPADGTSTPG